MMRLAEEVARQAGLGSVALHVRQVDHAAQELYSRLGYSEVERDTGLLVQLRGKRPRILMAKDV
jgi:ribosomal protein S18 acetylase RimI-like enzyme